VKHRDLIDRIEEAADAARTALIEGDDLDALAAAHLVNRLATDLTRALYDDEAKAAA
jgi:phage-related baseplate assembly protein